jgi:hypothetical protein
MTFRVSSNSFKDGDYLRSDSFCRPISALAALAATSRHILSGRVRQRGQKASLLLATTPTRRLAQASGTGW